MKNDDVVVWMCYTFDWSCVVLLLCSLTTMSVGVIVLDKYWITNYYYTQVVSAVSSGSVYLTPGALPCDTVPVENATAYKLASLNPVRPSTVELLII